MPLTSEQKEYMIKKIKALPREQQIILANLLRLKQVGFPPELACDIMLTKFSKEKIEEAIDACKKIEAEAEALSVENHVKNKIEKKLSKPLKEISNEEQLWN